ncbi:hypothetical protein [Tenacibaculum singaporense]|uniref:Uncharacterized protein n=1 Tax=Tenacibaculum singaporense TaxID=2358479 RepID=A0A3Q8RRF9_9FLAO|nr:hypothetical protein [Tenacibaculum singaporense]AZJ35153.1 hypothetical protein D6T69_06295 [Tenacibaculum singaporense]
MKKSILNLGKSVSKTEQKQINGGNESCPPTGCYYSDTPLSTPATLCGTCQDYHNLSQECQMKVLVNHECFSR